jgi:phosphomannomutase
VRERFENNSDLWARWDRLGAVREEKNALEWHLERVLSLKHVDVPAIRARALHVVVDGCASVGGVALPALLERLGAKVTKLDCEPNGKFTRELEPLPEHLGALGAEVRAAEPISASPATRTPIAPHSWMRLACRSARSTRSPSARASLSRRKRVRW